MERLARPATPTLPRVKKKGKKRTSVFSLLAVRNALQVLVCLVLAYSGWQFYLFVQHFETGGATPLYSRPSLVEGFLPIGGLVATKHLIVNGTFDTIHPAALVIFITIVAMSLLFKKAFCSWFCPAGTLFEWVWRLGRKVFGRNFTLPKPFDYALMSIKYLVLGFFIKAIVLDMDGAAVADFLQTPYNKVVDVKMLYFFTKMGTGVAIFLVALLALSALVKNFWCRYLCPYGALLGLVSYFSPTAVTRDVEICTDCKMCARVCPNRIDVARETSVESPECTGCLACVDACPKEGALGLRILGRRPLSGWAFATMLVGLGLAVYILAKATGHWNTSLSYADWAWLIPRAESFRHFY